MTKILLTIGTLFLLNLTLAQKKDSATLERQLKYVKAVNDTAKQVYWFNYLKDSSENLLASYCGLGGNKTTINTYFICHLINARRYDLIKELLSSDISTTRYLAALALIFADERSIYLLDSATNSQIDSLRKDTSPIRACSGCIYGVPRISFSTLYIKNSITKKRKRRKEFNWIESELYNCASYFN